MRPDSPDSVESKPDPAGSSSAPAPIDGSTLEISVHNWGNRIFALMDAADPPAMFSARGFYGSLMNWAMKEEAFKVQLFRFVDVLPTLTSSADVSRHLTEYLDNEQVKLSTPLRAALKASSFAGSLLGGGIRSQVTSMARLFMLGSDSREITTILRRLHQQDTAVSVDVLGEAVVSEREADDYAARYLQLLDTLAHEVSSWSGPCKSDLVPEGQLPILNVSLKVSAFYSQIQPADPDTAIERLSARLRPVLRRAKDLGAFINFDMESYALKNLTLRLFKSIFSEPEFAQDPPCGIALQAYLEDSETDLRELVRWAAATGRKLTVRLVKGAYWDYETTIAAQRGWPSPVFPRKEQTDANFEQLSTYLLENSTKVRAAFGSHNVRSLAHVLAQAQRPGLDPRTFEFQVLYGMADSLRSALLQLGCRVREYCPVGELLPGMAYLVRRLLENTSNEGFLARRFAKGASRDALLRNPIHDPPQLAATRAPSVAHTPGVTGFRNEPLADFTIASNRDEICAAIRTLKASLGSRHPLVIGGKPVTTSDWLASLNPADQSEIIGYSARGTVEHAESALSAAHQAQPQWARTPVEQRALLLDSIAASLSQHRPELTALCILEAGKPWPEADADVVEAIDFCRFYAQAMRELGRPEPTQIVPGETNYQHWWPRGIGVVISPWNFPLAILTGMMSAAIVTGNAVVLKPSDQTTVIASRLVGLLIEAGLPPGIVNLITGRGSLVGAHLVAHPHVDFIAFTGSVEVGCAIHELAGKTVAGQSNLKKVVCEMGGKNALIVDSDADLDEAVVGTLQSAFSYSGQKCSALSRLIVLEDNYDKFIDRLVAAAASLQVGPAEAPGTVIGPVIDRVSQQRILAILAEGKKAAKLIFEGKVPEDPNACYVPPTLFADVPPESRLFQGRSSGRFWQSLKPKTFLRPSPWPTKAPLR